MNDPLSSALSKVLNGEARGQTRCLIFPASRIIKEVFKVMRDHGYMGEYKEIKDSKGDVLKVNLLGTINQCGAIKPRFSIKKDGFEKFEKRYLPAKGFGILVVSTQEGLTTNEVCKKKSIGGRLIAYCY